jgi:predicted DsbA family dithiol-disulfide isomerase
MTRPVQLDYYSDILCVWAYVSQIRLTELKEQLGDEISIHQYFINVFGNTQKRVGQGWQGRGSFAGYGAHVVEVCQAFPHVELNPDAWKVCRPTSSAMAHLMLKAALLLEQDGTVSAEPVAGYDDRTVFEELVWRVRCAFFEEARDISQLAVLLDIATGMHLPSDALMQQINSGAAMAALCDDLDKKESCRLEGSPTYLLNDGRQKLYGNVGYRIVEANVLELLEAPQGQASWC